MWGVATASPLRPHDRQPAGERLHDAVATRLQREGVRYTRHRRALVDALRTAAQPLTIPEIAALAPTVPQSSIYRNLAVFEQAAVVHRLSGHGDFARYELAEELIGHHHHLVCASCGSMTDFALGAEAEAQLERALRQAARRRHFAISNHRLDVVGHCDSCRS
jgi:Fe2+ or Zn2+ uptake regulation protein